MVRALRVSPPAGRKRAGAACVSTSGVRVESPASAVGSAGVGELGWGGFPSSPGPPADQDSGFSVLGGGRPARCG